MVLSIIINVVIVIPQARMHEDTAVLACDDGDV
jgi:hypothetical protein